MGIGKYKDNEVFHKSIFESFDKNKDGTIDQKELGEVIKAIGKKPTDEEIRAMLHEIDTDGNGVIDF